MSIVERLSDEIRNEGDVQSFIKNNVEQLLSTHNLQKIYTLIKQIHFEDSEANVIKSWFALLSGNNLQLSMLANQIKIDELSKVYQGLFTDLHALSGVFNTPSKRLLKSDQAIEILNNSSSQFFLANAYLTRGQLHVGFEEYEKAADFFNQSYQLFLSCEAIFPAMIAITNRFLNLFRLGYFEKVNVEARQILLMTSVQSGNNPSYFDIIQLPLGMINAEKGKYKLAISQLKKAYKAIMKLNLIHMHGYVEIYLMTCYAITDNGALLDKLYKETSDLFRNMNYPMMDAILIYGQILVGKDIDEHDIEKIIVLNENQKEVHFPLLFELTNYFYMTNQASSISIDQLIEGIKHYRYIGDVINLAQALLILAEVYNNQKEEKACQTVLKEYIALNERYMIQAPLEKYQYHFYDILKTMTDKIKVPSSYNDLLTQKEMEILRLIQQGHTNRVIGEKLFISPGTVKWHANNIYSKLDVNNRLSAIEKAKQLHIL